MVISMKVTGLMIKRMGMVSMYTWMELSILDSGKKINNMVKAEKLGLMAQCMKVIMSLARNKAKVYSSGQMGLYIKVNLLTTTLKALESIDGQMAEYTKVNGKIIRCMEEEYSSGQMEDNMKEIILRIRNKVMVSLIGLMADNTLENGLMANNMEEEYSLQQILKEERVNGTWAREQDGWMNQLETTWHRLNFNDIVKT
jgi:hypothetical protein